jgi:hypothetical protein
MVDRKPPPSGETVATAEDAFAWLRAHADSFAAARGA